MFVTFFATPRPLTIAAKKSPNTLFLTLAIPGFRFAPPGATKMSLLWSSLLGASK